MVFKQFDAKYKEIEDKCKKWVAKQTPPVEVAVVTLASGIQGSVIGMLMGNFTSDMANQLPTPPGGALNPEAQTAMKQMQAISGGPWMQARNFAVMTGVNAGIACAIRRYRGLTKDDWQTSMASAFGSGVAFSLISGVAGGAVAAGGTPAPNPIVNAISTGVVFSLFQGAFFQVGSMISGGEVKKAEQDLEFMQTSSMLTTLGLQKYEKNFRKGLLNDRTLPLLNDSALQDVKIPPGPRLLILDHVRKGPKDDYWPDDAVPSET